MATNCQCEPNVEAADVATALSLVVVSYNTRDLLRQCLQSVQKHCPEAQVIVVDNGSKDGSPAMVRDEFADVVLLELPRNVGFAAGNNAGLPSAIGEFVVLLNSDTVLEDDSLQRCVAYFRRHPDVGALSPHLVGVDDRPQQCLYRFPNLRDKLRQAFRLNRPSAELIASQNGWLAGTALVLRHAALREVNGLLDDSFFMYWEDADLSARLQRAGWRVVAFPDACIRHYGGASGGGVDATRRPDLHAWYTYGEHRWFAKHRPLWEAAALWLLDFGDVFRRLLRGLVQRQRRGEWAHARAVAGVLCRRLVGLRPNLPGQSRR